MLSISLHLAIAICQQFFLSLDLDRSSIMSRHYSNRYPNYGGDYDADYDDPRDHRNNSKSRYHLPDPRDTSRYKTDADCDDPRDHHSNQHSKYIDVNDPWHIDPRDLNKWVPTDPRNHLSRNSDVTYPYEGISRTELRQNLGKNSGRRGKKPAMNQRMDFPLADLLFKRLSLHGGKPGSAMTSFHNQDTKGLSTNRRQLGGVGQMSPRHVRQSVSVSKKSCDR